jgi:hypothetical protein
MLKLQELQELQEVVGFNIRYYTPLFNLRLHRELLPLQPQMIGLF